MPLISVIIPTYNPNINRLNQTLLGLKYQTLPLTDWELIIIDNNSSAPFENQIALSWHPMSKVVKEPRQGLSYARLRGFYEATGKIIVMVDDDNILDPNYLIECLEIFQSNELIGAVGGKSIPLFEGNPPIWLSEFYGNLALRDLGDHTQIARWENKYPDCSPIGAGMAVRKIALEKYIAKLENSNNQITDRIGSSLSSGGDNDIVIEILKASWSVGYFPQLVLQHIISENRTKSKYLGQLVHDINISWIQLLNQHQICPWASIPKWTLPLRKFKAYFLIKPWLNEPNYIKWRSACGHYKGLATI